MSPIRWDTFQTRYARPIFQEKAVKTLTTHALLLALGGETLLAQASEQDNANGFLQDSQWSLLNRSLYDRRDYEHGALSNGARIA